MLITKGTGYCYEGLKPELANDAYLQGPGCDTGIYVIASVPAMHPDQLVKVVDDPTRHEFSADVRLPYSRIYGRNMPAQQTRSDQGYCSLEVVDVRLSRVKQGGKPCTKKGVCIVADGYKMADVARLAIYRAEPNLTPQKTLRDFPMEGHVTTLLGYATPEADGSVNFRVPCDTPYKLRGVAANGVEFVRDQVKHSNRPGEARQCLGCHAGHTMSDYRGDVRTLFARTIAAKKPPQVLAPR